MIKTEEKDGIMTVTLNYPEKLNCIGMEMLLQLDAAVVEAEENEKVKVLILTGAGERSFSTGANLKEFKMLDETGRRRWILKGNSIFNRLEQCAKPTIALVNGFAIGGGLELALCCDFRLGLPQAFFSSPELKHGWLPGWGGMTRLVRLLGTAKAKELVLLSKELKADEAISLGLLTQKINSREEAFLFAAELAQLEPWTYALAKAALDDFGRTTAGSDLYFDILAIPNDTK